MEILSFSGLHRALRYDTLGHSNLSQQRCFAEHALHHNYRGLTGLPAQNTDPLTNFADLITLQGCLSYTSQPSCLESICTARL